MTKLFFNFFIGQATDTKNTLLLFCIMNTDSASTNFETVHNQVIRVTTAFKRGGFNFVEIFFKNMSERMMLRSIFLFVLVITKHWEINNPKKSMTLTLDAKSISHVQTKRRKNCICYIIGICRKED